MERDKSEEVKVARNGLMWKAYLPGPVLMSMVPFATKGHTDA